MEKDSISTQVCIDFCEREEFREDVVHVNDKEKNYSLLYLLGYPTSHYVGNLSIFSIIDFPYTLELV